MITGWLDPKHSMEFDRTPFRYFTTSRPATQAQYKSYCYKAKDPRLVKVFYCHGEISYEVTEDFNFKEYQSLLKRKKIA